MIGVVFQTNGRVPKIIAKIPGKTSTIEPDGYGGWKQTVESDGIAVELVVTQAHAKEMLVFVLKYLPHSEANRIWNSFKPFMGKG